jgi:hypothetical protein
VYVIYYLENIGILKWFNGLQRQKWYFFILYWLLGEKCSTINVLQIFSYPLDVCKFAGIAGKYDHRWLSGDQYFFKELSPIKREFCMPIAYQYFINFCRVVCFC